MSYLLDTDICSAHLKENAEIGSRLLLHLGRLHVSTVTVAELYAWVLRKHASRRRRDGLQQLLLDVEILPVTPEVAHRFGVLQADFRDSGREMPGMDLLIAATALVHDLTIVTHNTQDFEDVPELRIVDWLVP